MVQAIENQELHDLLMDCRNLVQRIVDGDAQVECEDALRPLIEKRELLRVKRRKFLAEAFIAANGITKDSVQMSFGPGVPFFSHINQFVDWLKKTGCRKVFAEWNHTIYFTIDIMNGRLPEMPATIDDIQE